MHVVDPLVSKMDLTIEATVLSIYAVLLRLCP